MTPYDRVMWAAFSDEVEKTAFLGATLGALGKGVAGLGLKGMSSAGMGSAGAGLYNKGITAAQNFLGPGATRAAGRDLLHKGLGAAGAVGTLGTAAMVGRATKG